MLLTKEDKLPFYKQVLKIRTLDETLQENTQKMKSKYSLAICDLCSVYTEHKQMTDQLSQQLFLNRKAGQRDGDQNLQMRERVQQKRICMMKTVIQ